jgi:hypothetical protein
LTLLNYGTPPASSGGGFARFLARAVLLLAGLVFAASLLVVVMLLATVWLLRAGWARLTGKPITPWVMRVDPRAGWQRATRSSRFGAGGPGGPLTPQQRSAPGDVTDVEAKDVEAKEPRS